MGEWGGVTEKTNYRRGTITGPTRMADPRGSSPRISSLVHTFLCIHTRTKYVHCVLSFKVTCARGQARRHTYMRADHPRARVCVCVQDEPVVYRSR